MSSPLARLFALMAAFTLVITGLATFSGGHSAVAAPGDTGYQVGEKAENLSAGTLNRTHRDAGLSVVLFKIKNDRGEVVTQAYCIQMHVPTAAGTDGYTERPWDDKLIKNLPKVQWILNHSYPALTLDELRKATGIKNLTVEEAVVATQGAIWAQTDKFQWQSAQPNRGNSANAKKLFTYLSNNATGEATAPQLAISAPTTQVSGQVVTPITVTTTDGSTAKITISAPGKLTYVKGGDVDVNAVKSGEAMTFTAEKGEGEATITAEGTFTMPSGRVFFLDGHQTLISADKTKNVKSVVAKFSWLAAGSVPGTSTTSIPTSTTTAPAGTTTHPATDTATHSQPGAPGTTTAPVTTTTGPGAANPTTTVAVTAGNGDNGGTNGSVPPPMAQTGANVLAGVLAAVALLAAGGIFVLMSRKKSATR